MYSAYMLTVGKTGEAAARTSLVTGGSRGLGRAICVALAQAGHDVAFLYKSAAKEAEVTLQELRATGRRAWAFPVSVLDRKALGEVVATLEKEAGGVHVLVNNAGIGQPVPVALMEEDDWDKMMDTHVKGAFLASQAVMRGMIRVKKGRIINIGSLAGVKMMEAPVHYSAAKAALKGFTEALAKEIGPFGVTVNCVAPGILESGVSANLPEPRRAEYLRNCALRRFGTFEEVAGVVAFLASDASSYVNGATILVDGAV